MKYDMTNLKPRYRFTRIFRGFQEGDMVPETFDEGIIQTMLQVHKVERVPENAPVSDPALGTPRGEPAPRIAAVAAVAAVEEDDDWEVEEKQITKPPRDKQIKPNSKKVKTK